MVGGCECYPEMNESGERRGKPSRRSLEQTPQNDFGRTRAELFCRNKIRFESFENVSGNGKERNLGRSDKV